VSTCFEGHSLVLLKQVLLHKFGVVFEEINSVCGSFFTIGGCGTI